PATLIGGGVGIVPLMSMLRLRRRTGAPARLLVSYRAPADVIYPDELVGAEDTTIAYSRAAPPRSPRPAGRITTADVAAALVPNSTVYVCGSSRFVEASSAHLMAAGVDRSRVRIERFGPSGGS